MSKMKYADFLKGLQLALKLPSTYAFGGFGWPLNAANKKRLLDNKKNSSDNGIKAGINKGNGSTFAFDCVCLPKAILWGWNGDTNKNYGGAIYKSNGVPDVNADVMMTKAHVDGLSTNFANIKVGAFVGMKGHMGIYIGNGEVIECTPIWGGKVMITKLTARKWVNWGMSKYIDYSAVENPKPPVKPTPEYNWVSEPNSEFELNTNVWERNNPTLKDNAGKRLRSKGEVIPYNAYLKNEGYVWLRQLNGKTIPWRVDKGEKWGVVREPVSKPAPIKAGDKVEVINAIQYKGGTFKQWHKVYDVLSIGDGEQSDRIVIGIGNTVHAAVNVMNLKKV